MAEKSMLFLPRYPITSFLLIKALFSQYVIIFLREN